MKKIAAFFASVFQEFKKIRFPKRQEVVNTSVIALISILVFACLFYIMDLLSWLLVNKLIVGI